jgi:hypothetical protein
MDSALCCRVQLYHSAAHSTGDKDWMFPLLNMMTSLIMRQHYWQARKCAAVSSVVSAVCERLSS